MTTTRLAVSRHGNTFGPGDIVRRVGRTDLPLVNSGLEQGRLLGRYLKQVDCVPNMIFVSHLRRTIETAEQAQAEMGTTLPLQRLAVFDEIDYGPDENQPEEVVVARLGRAALERWDSEGITPDGWQVDPQLIIAGWRDFADGLVRLHAGSNILVVTSNGIARFSPFLTGDFAAFSARHPIKISTGAVCIFENTDASRRWTCSEWNTKPKDELRDRKPGP